MNSNVLKDKAQPLGHYPHVKRVGDFIYVSGTSSCRPDNTHVGATQDALGKWHLDIKLQTEAVINNIIALLSSMDAGKEDNIIYRKSIDFFLVEFKRVKKYV